MATIFYDHNLSLEAIREKRVGMIGYGNQGHAHALNLRDSGVNVVVGVRPDGPSDQSARAAGFEVMPISGAAQCADLLSFCVPDTAIANIYREDIETKLRPGQTLLFAHGFNIQYGLISPPSFVDVIMAAPNGAGALLRSEFVAGRGLPGVVAAHHDASGRALETAKSYAAALGLGRAGVVETTFKEETETDLFAEQVVLCGGLTQLIKGAFETLVRAGYQPEVAYFVCLHEVKLITDLIYRKGIAGMHAAISETAAWGSAEVGKTIIGAESRLAMEAALRRIQSGEFAADWIAESGNGAPHLRGFIQAEEAHPIEEVGKRLRAQMPFLNENA